MNLLNLHTACRHRVRRWSLGILLVLTSVHAAWAQPQPTVRLGPDPIGMREAAVLEVEVEGMPTNVHFDASFELDNLEVVSGPQQATALEIVNSIRTTRRTLSWRVRGRGVGAGRVHNIVVAMGDRKATLEPVSIKIQRDIPEDRFDRRRRRPNDPFGRLQDDAFERLFNRNRGRRARQPREAPKVFLQAEANTTRPFVGEQVVYTLYLYTQADILSFNHQDLPDFKGFWAHEVPLPDQRQSERVMHEGEQFGRVVLLQRALFARRAGPHEIAPVRVQMVARVPDDSPFGALLSRNTEIERVSKKVTLDVRALPEAPAGFSGAIGRLALTAELAPNDLAVGEAATLTLRLSGAGQLKGVPQPTLPELPGIKVFPPQQQASDRLRGTTLVGQRIWSFVLVPERPGEWDLPPIEIPYFDPKAGTFQTAAVTDLQLVARGATSLPQASGDAISLHPPRSAALPTARSSMRIGSWSPWLFVLPLALASALLLWRRRTTGSGQNARKTLLVALDAAGRQDSPRQVAAQVEDAWRAYLEQRWHVPLGTASTRWQAHLTAAGMTEPHAQKLVTLADDLHYLRYAPKLSSTTDLQRELIERSRKLARSLR